MGIDTILSRLQGVKRTAKGKDAWIARCPAHPDKSPSLSLRVLADGRILVHCFASCDVESILVAIDVKFEDLFPERLTNTFLPRESQPFSPMDALRCLAQESAIVAIAASDITLGRPLNDVDLERVATSAGRIASAMEVYYR